MAHPSPTQPFVDNGLRRRHSAPHNELPGIDLPAHPSRDSSSNAGPSIVQVYEVPHSKSEDSIPTRRKSSHNEPGSRVKFSTEIERIPMKSGGFATQTSYDGAARPPPVPSIPQNHRRGSHGLSLDTTRAAAFSSSSGQTSPRYSPTMRPASPGSSSNGHLDTAPLSPRSRLRGYSLRRTLFNKTMSGQADGSLMELESAGPSNAQSRDVHRPSKKQPMETIEAVSPTFEEDYSSPRKMVGLQGISALPHYENWIKRKAARNKYTRQIKNTYKRIRKFILRISEIPPSKDGRHLDIDARRKHPLTDERTGRPFISNIIRSCRYTPYNFLPRQLFAQFSKIANFYFLIISVLQMIPGFSTTGNYTTVIPLLFFVSISMAKEGYDDLRRNRLDKEENNREASVLHAYEPGEMTPSGGLIHWASTKWKNVQVGDIVKLERDQAAPADLVLLHSHGENGIAYIETMALDGETNLKSKQAPVSLSRTSNTVEKLANNTAHFVVEDPNLDLYNFEGRVTAGGETSPLSNNEVIYRGSILRNTSEAVGLVIYSGEECKIRMNANQTPRIKAPSLQAVVNKIVIVMVIFVISLSIFMTVAYELWAAKNQANLWYLNSAGVTFFQIFFAYIIMFNTMIPLSLYVSLEIVKVFQMLLLNDIDMYDEVTDTPMEAHTSTINEELGQINYIFSDKTGTLTDNLMKFRKMSVAGTAWLHDLDLKAAAAKEGSQQRLLHKKRNKGKKPLRKSPQSQSQDALRKSHSGFQDGDGSNSPALGDEGPSPGWKSSARPTKSQPEMETIEMIRYIQRKPSTAFAKKARFFLLTIALCHTCLPEKKEDGSINFQAASPDELALVQAAQELGYLAFDRMAGTLTLKTYPQGLDGEAYVEKYEILDVIEFSSRRKRMSVVVQFPDQRICVITKGADSIVTQLLRLSALAIQKTIEIEKRANRRKSIEAHQVMARKSEHHEARPSMGRQSISVPRTSINPFSRPSVQLNGTQPLRAQVDSWLTERERDVDASVVVDRGVYYDPRPSFQLPGRPSGVPSEGVASSYADDDFELVEESLVLDEPAVIERCFQHINDFATEGLRTLLYGYRFLGDEEYATWKKIYRDATTSLVDRQKLIEKAGELIERELELAGATAIEDKLQKGVPETIDKLRRANIKMWMLTGDKRETAINIGHSCRLIKDYSSVTVLDHESGMVEQLIATAIVDINQGSIAHSVVVIDGQTLSLIEADKSLKSLFYDLAIVTDSVICCRASPSQKAGLVKAIRHKVKRSITLAIGDGANDIAMIQEAHVGIGITGKEGLQAARTSDYSIAQFRFLTKLLLVHGRWNYIRTCKYVAATFWKELTFYLIQALYQRYAGYTGTSLFENWSLSMFNTLFTSLPVIFLGIFEKDLAASTLLAVPELYSKGQRNGGFNFKIYFWWCFLAASEAVILFFCMLKLFSYAGRASFNPYNDLFPMGDMCFTAVIILVSLKLQLIEMHNRSVANAVAIIASVGGWTLWNILLAAIYSQNTEYYVKSGLFTRFGRSPEWWLTLVLSVLAVLGLEVTVRVLKAGFFPSDTDVFKELEKDLPTKKRFEEASAEELGKGWEARGQGKKSSTEIKRAEEEEKVQREREREVDELLKRRGAADGVGVEVGVGEVERDMERGIAGSGSEAGGGKKAVVVEMRELRAGSVGSVGRAW